MANKSAVKTVSCSFGLHLFCMFSWRSASDTSCGCAAICCLRNWNSVNNSIGALVTRADKFRQQHQDGRGKLYATSEAASVLDFFDKFLKEDFVTMPRQTVAEYAMLQAGVAAREVY